MSSQKHEEPALKQQKYRSFTQISLIVLNLCFSPFYFGYSIAYFSTIDFSILIDIFGITMSASTAQGLLTGCIPIGGGIGALSSSLFIKYLSRRKCLLCINAIAIFFGLLIMLENTYTLFAARIGQGLCVGLYSAIVPLIIKELAPTQISGTLGAFNQLAVAFGVFFCFFFEFVLSQAFDNNGSGIWYIVFGLTLVTVTVQSLLLIFVFPYETPKYFLLKGNQDKARQMISMIYKDQYIEEVLQQKYNDLKGGKSQEPNENENVFQNQNAVAKQSVVTQESLSSETLLRKRQKNVIPKIVALHLALLQQFVGINVVVAYGPPIASEAMPDLNSSIIPMIINLEQVIGALACSYLLSKLGRKDILQAGCLAGTVSLLFITAGFFFKPQDGSASTMATALILIGLVIFMANFGLTLGPVVWLYIPEIVQPNFIPFTTAINWTGAALTMILFPILKDAMPNSNPAPLFLFFGLWTGLSFIVNLKFVVQTKGKNEQEIVKQYAKLS